MMAGAGMAGKGDGGRSAGGADDGEESAGMSRTASDRRLKENVRDGERSLRSFLAALGAHSYEYKDEKHGEGRFTSPMAQELAKSPIGRSMVTKDDEGHMFVDYARGLGAMLAAEGMHERRVSALEQAMFGKEKSK
jgi:hypothetical protein